MMREKMWTRLLSPLAILIPGVSRWQDDVSEIRPKPATRNTAEALAELADIAAQSEAALKVPAPRAKRTASG